MLQKLIEELEAILNETNKVKQSLNMICEKIWYLRSPPGIEGSGTFTLKNLSSSSKNNLSSSSKNNLSNSSESKPTSSETSDIKEPISLEDVLGNVSDLIAYGKHIRETVNVDNINKGKKFHLNRLYKTIDQCDSDKEKLRTGFQHQIQKQDSKCKLDAKPKIWEKSVSSKKIQDSTAISASLDKHKEKSADTNERNEQKSFADCESANKSNSNIYHHSCSNNLTELPKSLKVPSNLLHLLKLYHHYENDKLTNHHNANSFSEKFYNHGHQGFLTNIYKLLGYKRPDATLQVNDQQVLRKSAEKSRPKQETKKPCFDQKPHWPSEPAALLAFHKTWAGRQATRQPPVSHEMTVVIGTYTFGSFSGFKEVKSRLKNNMKINCKEEERNVKYLDVADGVYKSGEAKRTYGRLQNSRMQYKSQEQLCLLESRYQQLMEKQLQERLLNLLDSAI